MADVTKVLMQQLPTWFKPVLEYIAIMRAYGFTLEGVEQAAEQLQKNMFIQTADTATLQYWERLLSIPYRAGDTLDYRRQRILTALKQTVPYTLWDLRAELAALFGDDFTLEVNPVECWVKVSTTSDRYGAVSLLRDVIQKWMPAHLYIYSNQQVTNYNATDLSCAARISRVVVQTIGKGGS